jgi:DNA-binding GntR family transcriptional regulator
MPRSHNKEQYEENPEWERLHRAFHRALIAACGSRWLTSFCEQLADQSYRYRQLSVRRIYPKRHELDEHRVIMEAAINGDSDKTIALVTEHYQKTANVILADETAFPELAA